jgi:hypothetical protein
VGHRANYVIIERGRARAYYDAWGALGCTLLIADGARECRKYAESCETTRELMDWAFAEGGYLLDFDEKLAIVFGEPDVPDMDDALIPPDALASMKTALAAYEEGHEAFFRRSASGWRGWTLAWDPRGTDAFAEHLKKRKIQTVKVQPPSAPKRYKKRGAVVKIPSR